MKKEFLRYVLFSYCKTLKDHQGVNLVPKKMIQSFGGFHDRHPFKDRFTSENNTRQCHNTGIFYRGLW